MSALPRRLFAFFLISVATSLVFGQSDPPGRVGRISLASDGTTLRIGDQATTGGATVNWPVSTSAIVESGTVARTEARVGSTAIRLDGNTALEFAELSDERIWLRLHRGTAAIGIRNPEHAAELALDTSHGRIRFDGVGHYRIDVNAAMTAVTAVSGTARIEGMGLAVRAGERIQFFGGPDRNYVVARAVADDFAQWSFARERLEARADDGAASPEMTGFEELSRHGTWRETPEYGPAWFPQGLPGDWAPYRWGHWAWIAPWGWTWIDDAPWGFAPSHYGRWLFIGGSWAWLPGAHAARPIYAPALVVWMGNPGWQVAFSFGTAPAVGWFPLGPREPFYPAYRCSPRHVHHLNVTHVTNINIITPGSRSPASFDQYTHRTRGNAVTIVPGHTLTAGMPVGRTALPRPDPGTLTAAPLAIAPVFTAPLRDPNGPVRSGATPLPLPGKSPAPVPLSTEPRGKADPSPTQRINQDDPNNARPLRNGASAAAFPTPVVQPAVAPTGPAPRYEPLPATPRAPADTAATRPSDTFRTAPPPAPPVREPAAVRSAPEPARTPAPAMAAPAPTRPAPAQDGGRDSGHSGKGQRDGASARQKEPGQDDHGKPR